MRSYRFLALVFLVGVSRGLYITDDRTRDPSRPLPLPPEVNPTSINHHAEVLRRQSGRSIVNLPTPTSAPVSYTSYSATVASATVTRPSPIIPVAPSTIPTSPPTPVPVPMDLQLSYALSTSCLSHLSLLLTDPTFVSCLPFSLLLTTSTSFASLLTTASQSGNYTTLNNLIAYVSAPQPSSEVCDEYMKDAYARMTVKSSGCKGDIGKKGAASQAVAGLGNSALMRKASGMRDPDNGKWCYLEAVASDKPDDLYLWSLPAGIALPPITKPTCSKCSSLLLNHYTTSTSSTPSLNSTLVNAAVGVINGACGQGFAQYSVQPTTSSAAHQLSLSWSVMTGLVGLGSMMGMLII